MHDMCETEQWFVHGCNNLQSQKGPLNKLPRSSLKTVERMCCHLTATSAFGQIRHSFFTLRILTDFQFGDLQHTVDPL